MNIKTQSRRVHIEIRRSDTHVYSYWDNYQEDTKITIPSAINIPYITKFNGYPQLHENKIIRACHGVQRTNSFFFFGYCSGNEYA